MPKEITFALGDLNDRGFITLTPEGVDVIRAIVMRWILQADKGENAARMMQAFSPNPFSDGQYKYFRAAKSFLLARLTSHITSRLSIKDQLAEIARWTPDGQAPGRWRDAIREAEQMEPVDEPTILTFGRGGSDSGRGDIATGMEDGQPGPNGSATANASTPPDDSGTGRIKDRTAPSKGRRGKPAADS